MIHVGFTGTRFGATDVQLARMRELLTTLVARSFADEQFTAHHGDCVGADAQFHALARELAWSIVIHPPVDDSERANCSGDQRRDPLTHMKRNKAIVTESHLMLAIPRDMTEQQFGGTWKTIGMSRKAKKPLVIVFPDGTTHGEWP
jgi:hypothetical protein